MDNKISIEQAHNETAREALLSNAAFQRFAGSFEVYQSIMRDERINRARRELARKRMREVFVPRMEDIKNLFFADKKSEISWPRDKVVNHENLSRNQEAERINNAAIELCESGEFNKEKLAGMFVDASNDFVEMALDEWNPKPKRNGGNREIINEIVAFRYLNDDVITIDIIPTPLRDNLIEKVQEGMRIVAEKIQKGVIDVNRIFFESWLLGPAFEDKARSLLGEDIEFLETDQESREVSRILHQALFYNNRSLDYYLRTGRKPVVRAVYMTREKFIERFCGN